MTSCVTPPFCWRMQAMPVDVNCILCWSAGESEVMCQNSHSTAYLHAATFARCSTQNHALGQANHTQPTQLPAVSRSANPYQYVSTLLLCMLEGGLLAFKTTLHCQKPIPWRQMAMSSIVRSCSLTSIPGWTQSHSKAGRVAAQGGMLQP